MLYNWLSTYGTLTHVLVCTKQLLKSLDQNLFSNSEWIPLTINITVSSFKGWLYIKGTIGVTKIILRCLKMISDIYNIHCTKRATKIWKSESNEKRERKKKKCSQEGEIKPEKKRDKEEEKTKKNWGKSGKLTIN